MAHGPQLPLLGSRMDWGQELKAEGEKERLTYMASIKQVHNGFAE